MCFAQYSDSESAPPSPTPKGKALYIRLQHSVTLIGVTPMPLLVRLILHAESQQLYSLHPFVAPYIMHTKGPPACRGDLRI